MSRLEDLVVGARVRGIKDNGYVTVVKSSWCGNSAVELVYEDMKGVLDSQILYRDKESDFEVETQHLPWSFAGDTARMKLASEAYRISLAHLFDPYLAVHTSSVEPLPHQISAVYQEMLPRIPLRYILADDPGAGKTIMTGLYIKELIARGDLRRCLIVTPGSLVEQWQDELYSKFHLRFEILTNDRMESAVTGNIFTEENLCLVRMDKLARNDELKEKLKVSDWDLIVVDEAHKMSATFWGGEIKYTKRFRLGQLLSHIARNFLLLTATPHNGKETDFELFLSLIDSDRYGITHGNPHRNLDVGDVMRRLVKEELLKFDGTPLFPERRAYTVNYALSPLEAELYSKVTEYVQEEFNRADKLNKERKNTVGFALTILQRRLASSPEAIYQSLRRRRERLERRLSEERTGKGKETYETLNLSELDDDDLPSDEQEQLEQHLVDHASAAATISEMQAEIHTLQHLEHMANEVRASGVDRKWDELSNLLQDRSFMFEKNGQREKLIIFTEHKDTLQYLAGKIRSLLGDPEAVVTIRGGMARDERRKVEEQFKQDVRVRILIATDAAGEGINLQRAHLMINYDLPWNPNRLEQRCGRIHRIGQLEVCHLWNMVASETREGYVFRRLFSKLEEERKALGGKVFDILGKMTFENKPLKDLLIEAIRYGNDLKVRDRLTKVVDTSMNPKVFRKLIEEQALTNDVMDVHIVNRIKEDMERMEAHKLQPHFIESFFLEAFKSLGGQARKREAGRYELPHVPAVIRRDSQVIGYGNHVLRRYERICFDKSACTIPGKVEAELICPGHPLLEAVIDLILERNRETLKEGTIFIDDNDYGTDARLLVYIEDTIQDGIVLPNGKNRIISKHMHFVELKEDGSAKNAGYAPYLDYREIDDDERKVIHQWVMKQNWLCIEVEKKAKEYAIEHLIPAHLEEVKKQKNPILNKTARAVEKRLTREIQYWDAQAAELERKEEQGKVNAKLNSQLASQRADELARRKAERIAEIGKEKNIYPLSPIITGGALVIPKGLLYQLMKKGIEEPFGQSDRKSIEYAAMQAVIAIEKRLGFIPKDVSAEKCGYDVESVIPIAKRTKDNQNVLRFIEVKGRRKGADTVTVSKNEILTALNRPEEFILAIVEVDGKKTHTIYLQQPFQNPPDFTATSINYDIQDLVRQSRILFQE